MSDMLDIRPLTGAIGAEIHGVDLGTSLAEETRAALVGALDRHNVIFFPPQEIGHDGLVALAQAFGTVAEPVNYDPGAGHPEVREFVNQPIPWHADVTWMTRPPGEQAFQVVEVPPVGGDTLWASTEAAYDRLSPGLRAFVDGLSAVHDERMIRTIYGDGPRIADRPPVTHPLVRVHPRSGRRSLFVNPMYTSHIAELSRAESRHVLALLFEHILMPEHLVRYRWRRNSIAVWDNRATWHYAVGDYGNTGRKVQRVSTEGEAPFGISATLEAAA